MGYILIVDDDEDYAEAAASVLQRDGHEVGIELNPKNAMSSMEKRLPDLVVLDVMFPEDASAGFELARKIRGREKDFGRVPLLMLTAVNTRFPLGFSARDIDDSWLPVAEFLEKPVDFDLLRGKVSALMQKAAADRQPSQ